MPRPASLCPKPQEALKPNDAYGLGFKIRGLGFRVQGDESPQY